MKPKMILGVALVGATILGALAYVVIQALLPYGFLIGLIVLIVLFLLTLGGTAYLIVRLKIHLDVVIAERDLRRVKVTQAQIEMHYVRPSEHGMVQAIYDHQTGITPLIVESPKAPQITARAESLNPEAPTIPKAPPFPEMYQLNTIKQMVLCYIWDGARSVPAFGTVSDLLSMAVSGKPGRGKTTALMYYITALLSIGAEVIIWDPHGVMNELAALNNQPLPNLPETARVIYLDQKDTIVASVPLLFRELARRDDYYRKTHTTRHPLLLLADELPVLADYEEEALQQTKTLNQQRRRENLPDVESASLFKVIRKFVLEARKWNCFFIGSGQSFDAEILPTKITDNLSSRIVFFNPHRRARMSGLENDAVKTLLPLLRRGGSGVMIFDCSRWDEPLIGAIPYITVEDMLSFCGVPISGHTRDSSGTPVLEQDNMLTTSPVRESQELQEHPQKPPKLTLVERVAGLPEQEENPLPEPSGVDPEEAPELGAIEYQFSEVQIIQFKALYPVLGSINRCLKELAVGNRYQKHASFLVQKYDLRKAE